MRSATYWRASDTTCARTWHLPGCIHARPPDGMPPERKSRRQVRREPGWCGTPRALPLDRREILLGVFVEGDAALLLQDRDLHVSRIGQPDVHERRNLGALDAQVAVVDVDAHLGDHAAVVLDL